MFSCKLLRQSGDSGIIPAMEAFMARMQAAVEKLKACLYFQAVEWASLYAHQTLSEYFVSSEHNLSITKHTLSPAQVESTTTK